VWPEGNCGYDLAFPAPSPFFLANPDTQKFLFSTVAVIMFAFSVALTNFAAPPLPESDHFLYRIGLDGFRTYIFLCTAPPPDPRPFYVAAWWASFVLAIGSAVLHWEDVAQNSQARIDETPFAICLTVIMGGYFVYGIILASVVHTTILAMAAAWVEVEVWSAWPPLLKYVEQRTQDGATSLLQPTTSSTSEPQTT